MKVNSWDDVISLTYVEAIKDPEIPNIDKEGIWFIHKQFWTSVREMLVEKRIFPIESLFNFYLKRQEIIKYKNRKNKTDEKG